MTPLHQTPSDAELDPLLRTHLGAPADPLTPSSGFTASVMDALHHHAPPPATIPPPIPFPWKQALPFAAALLSVFAAFILYLSSHPASHMDSQITPLFGALAVRTLTLAAAANTLLSTVAAIALSFAAAVVSFQLAGGRR